MSVRGRKVGGLKTQTALKSLEDLKQGTGHDLAYIRVKRDSKNEPRGLSHLLVLVCACCRRKGSPTSFSNKPCSSKAQAVPKVFFTWLQDCCKGYPENGQLIKEALKLSDADAAVLRKAARFRTFFKQPPFFRAAACFATKFGHRLRPVKGQPSDDKSTAQKQPLGHCACLRCWRTNPQGSMKLWGSPCATDSRQALSAQARSWDRTIPAKQLGLCKVWGVALKYANKHFSKIKQEKALEASRRQAHRVSRTKLATRGWVVTVERE